jgi:Domain of unknown function (DUF4336)
LAARLDYSLRMSLTAVAPGLWSIAHTMRFPGGVRIPTRMSVVRLGEGDLWVHSPIPVDDALAAEIAALGQVRYVVAPSASHHIFVGPFAARFPEAKLFAAPGVAKKHPELTFAGTVGRKEDGDEDAALPWAGAIDQVFLAGAPQLSEVVFFHRESRSLLVSDLLFNMTEPETWVTGMLLRVMGTYKRLARSRLWSRFAKDRRALKASIEKVIAWDFVRLLPAHGAVFESGDTHAQVREQLAWFLAV